MQSGDPSVHYVTFVRCLGSLTEAQLEELENRAVEEGLKIQISEDWIAEQKEYGIVFLMRGTDYNDWGVSVNDANKVCLKRAKRRYRRAVKDDDVDAMVFEPLAFCFNRAVAIRNVQSATRKRGVKAETIADKFDKLLNKKPELSDCTAEELAAKLKCSSGAIKESPAWKRIMQMREGARNAYLGKDKTETDFDEINDGIDLAAMLADGAMTKTDQSRPEK